MSYEPDITPEAYDDLYQLIDCVSPELRGRVYDAVLKAIEEHVRSQNLPDPRALGRPTYPLFLDVDRVRFWWRAAFKYSEDEKHIVITHIYRGRCT